MSEATPMAKTVKFITFILVLGTSIANADHGGPTHIDLGLSVPSSSSTGTYTVTWNGTAVQLQEKVGSGSYLTVATGGPKTFTNKPDGTYSYRNYFQLCIFGCVSYYSAPQSIIVSSGPAIPSAIAGPTTDDDGSYTLSWGSVSGATAYELERRSGGGSWAVVQNTVSYGYDEFSIAEGTYEYRVRACASGGCSGYTSAHTVAVTYAGSPSPPSSPLPPSPMSDPGPLVSSDQIGSTEGRFRVSESGAATYSISIASAAGTAGVQPSISLNYSSSPRNGVAGIGWGVSGISTISRCRKTLDQDHDAKSISFTSEDRFCLDGQRLFLTSGSSYGAAGSEYSPEIDTGIRVKAIGQISGEPQSFEVRRKDGSLSLYGGTANSDLNNGNGSTLTWGIREFRDNVGNPMKFEYESSSSALRIAAIKYGYGSGSLQNASIEFEYESRPDPIRGYVSGHEFTNDKRLSHIRAHNTISGTSNEIRAYTLRYGEGQNVTTDDLSRLTSVQECANGVCLPKTTFDWIVPASAPYVSLLSTKSLAESSDLRDLTLADIDGDSQIDLVWLEGQTTGSAVLNFAISNGTTLTQKPFSTGGLEYVPPGSADNLTAIDYNLDGRHDVAYWDEVASIWKVVISVPQADGSWRLESSTNNTPINDEDVTFVDVNSDGATDAVWMSGTGSGSKQLKMSLLVKNPNRSTSSSTYYHFDTPVDVGTPGTYTNGNIQSVAADFDGNGRVGIVTGKAAIFCEYEFSPPLCLGPKHAYAVNIDNPNSASPTYSNYSSLNSQGQIHSDEHVAVQGLISADVNSDGLSDLFYPVYRDPQDDIGQYHLAINKGDGSFSVASYYEPTIDDGDARRPQFVDWNSDGFPDLMWKSTVGTGTVYVRYWNPSTQTLKARVTATDANNQLSESVYFPDINGDGVSDFVKIDLSTGQGTVRMYSRKYAGTIANRAINRIEKFTNGLGAATTVDYEPLSTSANYERLELGTTTGSATFCEYEPGFEFCWDQPVQVADSASFYATINADEWDLPQNSQSIDKVSPVLEFSGAMYVVTQVEGDAPAAHPSNPNTVNSNAKSSISFRYFEAKVQAAGRGFLGFQRLSSTDNQTGVETTTRYRQDWPFVGRPIGTVVKTSDNAILSTSEVQWEIIEWPNNYLTNFESGGSSLAGPAQIVQSQSSEELFSLVTSGSAYLQGSSLGRTITSYDYDAKANVTEIKVEDFDQSDTLVQELTTSNDYYDLSGSSFELWEGRLSSTSVTTIRPGLPTQPARLSSYSYYAAGETGGFAGMLKSESIESGNSVLQLTTTHRYDVWGNLRRSSATDGVTTRCDVDVVQYESSGRYVERQYDCQGALISEVVSRSKFGEPTHLKSYIDDGVSASTYESFGALGRKYFTYSQVGSSATMYTSTSTALCPSNAVLSTTTTDATGTQTGQCLDILGRKVRDLKTAFDGTQIAIDYEFDELGQLRRQSEAFNLTYDGPQPIYWTAIEHDLLGRVTLTEPPGVASISVEYLGLETRTTVHSSSPQTKREIRNVLGEITSIYDADGGHSVYDYDIYGNLIYVAGPDGHVTTSKFDKLGRKEWTDDPNKGKWYYEYTNYGELRKETDAKGQIVVTTYDDLGRVKTRTDKQNASDAGTATTWYYDSALNGYGQIDYVHDADTGYTKTYSYDSFGRSDLVTTDFSGQSYAELTTYDQFGRIFQYFDAAGTGAFDDHGIVNIYNAHGYLEIVADAVIENGFSREVYRQIESMNSRGQVTVEKRGIKPGVTGPSITITYDYWDTTGLIKDIDATNRNGDDVQDLYYNWDAVGNLERRHEQSGSKNLLEQFTYDNLNRLVSFGVGADAVNVTYTPDRSGNIDSYTKNGQTFDYSYSGSNAGPHAVSTFNGKTLKYDANGNNYETRNSGGSVEREIDYTLFDKAEKIEANGNVVEFDYAPDRARYRRIDSTGGSQTVTAYIGSVEVVTNPDGSQQRRRYIAGAAMQTTHFNTSGMETSRSTQFTLFDHLGSMDVITHADGTIAQEFSFDAWGQRRNAVNWTSLTSAQLWSFDTSITPRGFTGHEGVDSVGIIHMNGRIYDPTMGRFLQADPFVQDPHNSQSLNRYSYVLNNPLNTVDPSGYLAFLPALIGLLSSFGGAALIADGLVWAGLAVAFFGNAMAALMTGADLSDAFISGISAAAFAYVGGNFDWAKASNIDKALAALKFGTIGGITAALQDRKFGHGFLTASVGMVVGAKYFSQAGSGNYLKNAFGRIITGGTLSEATGGKFANGAKAAAFAVVVGGVVQGYRDWKSSKAEYVRVKRYPDGTIGRLLPSGEGTLFTNGINNDQAAAIRNGFQQCSCDEYDLFYNPTSGIISDLTESALGKILGSSSLAKQLASVIKTSNYTNLISHSQGTIIHANALESLAMAGESFQGLHVIFNGGAAHYATTERLMIQNGGTFESFSSDNAHIFDAVPNIVGMNTWNPVRIFGSLLASPLLGFGPGISPHSEYNR